MVHILTSSTSRHVYGRQWWREKWKRSSGLRPGRGCSVKRGGAKSQTSSTSGFRRSPCRRHARLLPLRLQCAVLCQRRPRCISTDVSAPVTTARPLSSRTPTVAPGTVIFVNATPVASQNSPEWSGPNKHRHGRFRLFFTLFPGHGEWRPDPGAAFKHSRIAGQFREPSVLKEPSADADLHRRVQRKVRRKDKNHTWSWPLKWLHVQI